MEKRGKHLSAGQWAHNLLTLSDGVMGVNKNISGVSEESALKHDNIKAKSKHQKLKMNLTKSSFLSLMKTHEPLSINHQDVH